MGHNIFRKVGEAILGELSELFGRHYGHILFEGEKPKEVLLGCIDAGGDGRTLAEEQPTCIQFRKLFEQSDNRTYPYAALSFKETEQILRRPTHQSGELRLTTTGFHFNERAETSIHIFIT